jgi:hypothetical protein
MIRFSKKLQKHQKNTSAVDSEGQERDWPKAAWHRQKYSVNHTWDRKGWHRSKKGNFAIVIRYTTRHVTHWLLWQSVTNDRKNTHYKQYQTPLSVEEVSLWVLSIGLCTLQIMNKSGVTHKSLSTLEISILLQNCINPIINFEISHN